MIVEENQAKVQPKDIAEDLLGTIKWEDENKGYCNCPGEHLHNCKTGNRDCIVYLNGAATIFCMHQSCKEEVQETAKALRLAIHNKAPVDPFNKPSAQEQKQKLKETQRRNQLEIRTRASQEQILKKFKWTYSEIKESCPDKLSEDASTHWRDIVGLFKPDDVVWIGNRCDSGSAAFVRNFKKAKDWLEELDVPGPLICPATFKCNAMSRSNDNVLHRRFLVVESDVLTKDVMGAIFKWLRDEVGLTLRAIVDTAGKSLHAWFDCPKKAVLEELEIMLPQIGCDPGLFRESQPCRIPGPLRDESGKRQHLVYLDTGVKPRVPKQPRQVLPLPELLFDGASQCYWRQNGHGGWQKINESSLETELIAQGFDSHSQGMDTLSEVRQAKRSIQINQDVAYAGPLAGYHAGMHIVQGGNILVTTSPKIIEAKAGEWPTLQKVIDGLLIDGNIDQRPYFYGWLKQAYQSLSSGMFTPGQALCLAGPRDCGKSLLQLIITEILGGRSAKPYDFLTGATTFNADQFAGEHLMIEDDVASIDIRARRRLGAGIKSVTVNVTHKCHAKNKTALMLTPFWRLSISVNEEPENLLILPPLDESLQDKLILLKACLVKMPMPTMSPGERKQFWDTLMSELPGFLYFLKNWEIPDDLRSDRFGIKEFHHPTIAAALTEAQPEQQLLAIIDEELFPRPVRGSHPLNGINYQRKHEAWKGSAEELAARLNDNDCRFRKDAEKLLYFSSACGTYLGRLKKSRPDRVTCTCSHNKRTWQIQPPCVEEEVKE